MLTTAHAILGAATLHQNRKFLAPALIGGFLPDLSMFFMVIWGAIQGTDQNTLWEQTYYEPFWMNLSDLFHSIVIIAAILIAGEIMRNLWVRVLGLSMLLHAVTDLLLHHDDGHRHFWPLNNWIYMSPVSYWDPAHYGVQASIGEFLLVLFCSTYLWKIFKNRSLRALLVISNLLYIAGLVFIIISMLI